MNILWLPFFIIMLANLTSILAAIYLSKTKSYDCTLVNTVGSECIEVQREYDTYYHYNINCTMDIDHNITIVESHCSSWNELCADCINKYRVNKTYICWYFSTNSKYTFSWNNYNSYPSLYITMIILSILLGIALMINAILIWKINENI